MGFGKSVDIAEIGANNVGSDVELGGWVEDIRKMAKVSFLTLRDRTMIKLWQIALDTFLCRYRFTIV